MAVINANSVFLLNKRTTIPVVKTPKSVRECLNIDQIEESGIFKLEPGKGMRLYDACYQISDINYINKDEDEKQDILLGLCKWLNAMSADFKICCANEYIDGEAYLQTSLAYQNEGDYPQEAKGMTSWIKERAKECNVDIQEKKYLVVTCRAQSFEEAANYIKLMDSQITNHFSTWNGKIIRLNAKERLRILHKFFRMGREDEFDWGFEACLKNKRNWRNDILPNSIEQQKEGLLWEDTHASVLYCRSMSNTINTDTAMVALMKTGFPSIITLDYAPIEKEQLMNKLGAIYTNNEKAISDETDRKNKNGQYGSAVSYAKETRKSEVESYMDQIKSNDESGFFLGILAMITAPSAEELENRIRQFTASAKKEGLVIEPYRYRQLKALNTVLPFGGRQVNCMRCVLTSSAVGLHPYYAQDLYELNGYVYGRNVTTKQLIRGNRKNLGSPHGFIVGHTGSGKSVVIKMTEIYQTLLFTQDDVLILDPKSEMREIIENIGGSYFDFTPKTKLYINPLEIPKELFQADGDEKEKFIADKSDFAVSFCSSIMVKILFTQEHISVIGRCVRKMYDKAFRRTRRTQVTLKDLRKQIGEEEKLVEHERDKEILHSIYTSLEEYTDGAYDMFSHPTNIQMDNRLIGFGLLGLPKTVWEPAMLLIMHFLQNRVQQNHAQLIATHFVVDESQFVCERETSAAQLLQTVELFRSLGAIVTLAAQNLSRILENAELRDMFSNCGYKCFLDSGGVDANALTEIQKLSSTEYEMLNNNNPGTGIMIFGTEVLIFDAYLDKGNPLYASVNTNLHEKAAEEKAVQEKEGLDGTKKTESDKSSVSQYESEKIGTET